MDRGLAVVLSVLAGGLVALQAPLNGRLGREIGTLEAATASFLIGTAVLALVTLAAGGSLSGLGRARGLPWYYLTGGVLGAALVSVSLVAVRTLGAGGLTAALIAGQLVVSLLVDQLGLLGVARSPITPLRVLGVGLLAVGVLLVVRR